MITIVIPGYNNKTEMENGRRAFLPLVGQQLAVETTAETSKIGVASGWKWMVGIVNILTFFWLIFLTFQWRLWRSKMKSVSCLGHRWNHEVNSLTVVRCLSMPLTERQRYENECMEGERLFTECDVYLLSTVRNRVERYLPGFQKTWIPLLSQAKSYHVFWAENDSSDRSREILKGWQLSDPEHISILCGRQEDIPNGDENECHFWKPSWSSSSSSGKEKRHGREWKEYDIRRTERMAYFRNVCLDACYQEISKRGQPVETVLILVMDPDLEGTMDMNGFFHAIYCLMHPSSHFCGLAVNGYVKESGRFRIFDTYPLVPLASGIWKFPSLRSKMDHDRRVSTQMGPRLFLPRPVVPVVSVSSAFGGAAVYRGKYLQRGGEDNNEHALFYQYEPNDLVCEHTTLHRQLPEGSIGVHLHWSFEIKKNYT